MVKLSTPLHGSVAAGFEAVQEEFTRNFVERGEIGAACTIYHQGKRLVDLWGGYRNGQTREPWEEDTMVLVFSSTKGLSALAVALAHSRGYFDYEAAVADYWPEFAQNGKAHITIRQLLAHEAGLAVIEEPLTMQILADKDALAKILARQRPLWEPGKYHGYHAFSLGWYQSELIRRTDPQHRTLGQFFQDELAQPLGLEFYIGTPLSIPERRIATLTEPGILPKIMGMPTGMMLSALNPRSLIMRTANPRMRSNLLFNQPHVRAIENPSAGGIGQASSIARAYSIYATGGHELNIGIKTLEALQAPAQPPSSGEWRDLLLQRDMAYSLGFLKPFTGYHFGSSDAAFGAPGSGGSFGFADPAAQVGYAYVMNRQGVRVLDEPREKILRDTFYQCLSRIVA